MIAATASPLATMAQDWRIVIDAQPENMDSAARLFHAAIDIFEAWSAGPDLLFFGDENRSEGVAGFDDLIARGRRNWANGDPAPILASDSPSAPSILAVIEPADLFDRRFDRVWIKPDAADGRRPGKDLRGLLVALSAIDHLVNVSVQHELLDAVFYARASATKAFETTPEALRSYLPPVLIPNWGLPDPDLVLPDDRMTLRLPEAIWGANLFGPGQVKHLGRDAVLAADWHLLESLPSGAMLALATTQPPQSMDAETARHILHITAQLDLPALQRAIAPKRGGAR